VIEVVWIEDEATFRRFASRWDEAIYACADDNPFALSDFVLTWWRYFSDNRSLRICALIEEGKVVGGVPLYCEKHLGVSTLRYAGAEDFKVANYTNFISLKPLEYILDHFFRSLDARDDWDILLLDRLYGNEKIENAIRCQSEKYQLIVSSGEQPTFVIELVGTHEELLGRLPKKLRYTVRRGYKESRAQGDLDLKTATSDSEIDRVLSAYIGISIKAFAARGEKSTFTDAMLRNFFTDLIACFQRRGILEVNELLLDKQSIAIHIGYGLKNKINYVLTTYDVDASQFDPGHLLISELARKGLRENRAEIDLFTGDVLYKRQWATRRDRVMSFTLMRNTWLIRMRLYGQSVKNYLKQYAFLRSIKRSLTQ